MNSKRFLNIISLRKRLGREVKIQQAMDMALHHIQARSRNHSGD